MYDVVVVGGGAAGLSAALILGRARRRVLVLDAGTPRNTPAEHAHGFLSRDGIPPSELLRISRDDLAAYSSVTFANDESVGAQASGDGYAITLSNNEVIEARKIVLASGVVDILPEIPGVHELWGQGVYHCPYCHGWEVRDTAWGALGKMHLLERVPLYQVWASRVVALTDGPSSLGSAERERLAAFGAGLDERRIARVARADGDGVRVFYEDGASTDLGALFVAPSQVQRSPFAEMLGCEMVEPGPVDAKYVRVDGASGETSVPGVYAAGDMTGPAQSLILAAASGARAAYHLNRMLAVEDAESLADAASPTA